MSALVLSNAAAHQLLVALILGAAVVGLLAWRSLRHEARGGTIHAHPDGTVHEHAGGHRHHEHPTWADRHEALVQRVFREDTSGR